MAIRRSKQEELARQRYEYFMQRKRSETTAKNKYLYFNDVQLFFGNLILLKPQQYGPLMQRFVKHHTKLSRVHASKNRGDFVNKAGSFIEFKGSFPDRKGSHNFLQIRSYQDLKYHLFLVVVVDEGRFRFSRYYFLLDSNQIDNEVKSLGGLCHLTKEAAINNSAVEHRITLDQENFNRWLNMYKIADNEKDLKKAVLNL